MKQQSEHDLIFTLEDHLGNHVEDGLEVLMLRAERTVRSQLQRSRWEGWGVIFGGSNGDAMGRRIDVKR